MVMPVRQRCPECGGWFIGSDCLGRPCNDCQEMKAILKSVQQQAKEMARKERAGERISDDLLDFRMKNEKVFTNCNVCGIKLRTDDENQMGMCERCADE